MNGLLESRPASLTTSIPSFKGHFYAETKLFRGGAKAAHLLNLRIEGEQYEQVLTAIKVQALALGCYKIIFNCQKVEIPNYLPYGYEYKELHMQASLDPKEPGQLPSCFRKLKISDLSKGFAKSLSALKPMDIPEERVPEVLMERKNQKVKTYVLENDCQMVVATAALFVNQKGSSEKMAYVEDVSVDADCQGKGFGKLMMTALKVKAAMKGCQSIALDCSEKNRGFYERCGFTQQGVQMRLDLMA